MNLLIVIETKVLIKILNKSVSIWLVTRLSYFEFFILGYFSHVLRYFFLLFPETPGMCCPFCSTVFKIHMIYMQKIDLY